MRINIAYSETERELALKILRLIRGVIPCRAKETIKKGAEYEHLYIEFWPKRK